MSTNNEIRKAVEAASESIVKKMFPDGFHADEANSGTGHREEAEEEIAGIILTALAPRPPASVDAGTTELDDHLELRRVKAQIIVDSLNDTSPECLAAVDELTHIKQVRTIATLTAQLSFLAVQLEEAKKDRDKYLALASERFHRNPAGESHQDLRARLAALEEDKRRLDWLEGELDREQQLLRTKTEAQIPVSLFRKNVPITRAAIDSALSSENPRTLREGEKNPGPAQ